MTKISSEMESPLEKYIDIHSSFRNEALDWLER